MSSELLEQMEHAAHADSHGHGHGHAAGPVDEKKKSLGKYIGITMAMLGVLMAVCSALVGMSRTELIATMVQQTDTSNLYQAVSSKYRLMQSQLQATHAFLMTDPTFTAKIEAQMDDLEKQTAGTPTLHAIKALRVETANLMGSVIPATSDVVAMAKMAAKYREERDAAHEWAESYEDKVKAFEGSGEHYEWGQLAAEIGIVLASIALLLTSRAAWMAALSLGLASLLLIAGTWVTGRKTLHKAEEKIATAHAEYSKVAREKEDDAQDEKLIDETIKMEDPKAAEPAPAKEGEAPKPEGAKPEGAKAEGAKAEPAAAPAPAAHE